MSLSIQFLLTLPSCLSCCHLMDELHKLDVLVLLPAVVVANKYHFNACEPLFSFVNHPLLLLFICTHTLQALPEATDLSTDPTSNSHHRLAIAAHDMYPCRWCMKTMSCTASQTWQSSCLATPAQHHAMPHTACSVKSASSSNRLAAVPPDSKPGPRRMCSPSGQSV